jgi:hypothetical protein
VITLCDTDDSVSGDDFIAHEDCLICGGTATDEELGYRCVNVLVFGTPRRQ